LRAVVDTNVIAYTLLGTEPFAGRSLEFWQHLEEGWAPASWEAEVTNVLWMAVRQNVVTAEVAAQKLRYAGNLGIVSVPVRTLWEGALQRAVTTGVAAYDTLFVELAIRQSLPLVTFDRQLLDAFPECALLPTPPIE
jgi:predicted nucleic acid-binding protein